MSSKIIPGSYVWYTRKKIIAKVLEYDRCSDSYTIEYKGKIVDTLPRFIDHDIGSKYIILTKEKSELEEKISDLKALVELHQERNSYVSTLVSERTSLESDIKILKQKVVDYRNMYEKSVILVEGKEGKEGKEETIVINNHLQEKTDKFVWNGIDLYDDFEGLKSYLIKEFNIATRDTSSIGNCCEKTVDEFQSWSLQTTSSKLEYIVGVYYTVNSKSKDNVLQHRVSFPNILKEKCHETFNLHVSGGYISDLIFYTNYGNIISIVFYPEATKTTREIIRFTTNKILSAKMINIINKSISSGFNKTSDIVTSKTGEELHDFIKEVIS